MIKARKFLTVILAIFSMFAFATFTACGDEECSHQWGAWSIQTEASCTANGVKIRKCSQCNESQTLSINRLEHEWGGGSCLEPRSCIKCNTEDDTLLGHSGGMATCQKKAKCSVCGSEYGELNSANHENSYTYISNGNGTHIKKYDCCNVILDIAETCSGGTPTCSSKPTCIYCNGSYGDLGNHAFDQTKWGYKVASGHAHLCSTEGCNAHDTIVAHHSSGPATETEAERCLECGYIIKPKLPSGGDQTPVNPGAPSIYEVIKFDKDKVKMLVGDELYLLAKNTSYTELKITYSSSNPEIISVDKLGRVVALKKGRAKVIAGSGKFRAECEVNVSHGNLLPELSLYGQVTSDYTISHGKTSSLNFEVLFNQKKYENITLVASANNDNISVEINDNAITIFGKTRGETQLTVKAIWDGLSTLTKTITVNVIGDVVIIVNGGNTSSVTLFNKQLPTFSGNTPVSADFVVTVNGTSNQPIIEVENTDLATYQNGVITGKGILGSTKAIVSVVDEDGDTFSLTVPINIEKAVGDYMEGGDYKTVDFDTLTGEIDLNAIFGKEVTLEEAFHGYQELKTDGNKITDGIKGQAFGTPEPIVITVMGEDEGYNVKIVPYVFKNAEIKEEQYQFSSYNGEFFDTDFKLVDIETLLGEGKTIKNAYLKTDDGQIELPINVDETTLARTIGGLDLTKAEIAKYTLAITSDDRMVCLEKVDGYSLIIDEMSDFSYFYVPDGTWTYNRQTRWNVTSGMNWSGYYVLANDIDYQPDNPDAYKHKGYETAYPHVGWGAGDALTTANFGTVGASQTETNNLYKLAGKGLTGIFDGRGHVIDGYVNYTWKSKGDEVNKLIDKALAGAPTDANTKTANTWKAEGISATNGGLFQLINGGQVKNLGFTNARLKQSNGLLSAMTINGAQIENVYVHVDPNHSYNKTWGWTGILSGTSGKSVFYNNVIIDNESDYIGSWTGVFGTSGTAYEPAGSKFNNVYVISKAPITGAVDGSLKYAAIEAEYVDGVKQETGNNVDDVTDNDKPDNAYTRVDTVVKGINRFTTYEKFSQASSTLNFETFDSSLWTTIDGVPFFKNAIKEKDLQFFIAGKKAEENVDIDITNNLAKIPITVNYKTLKFDEVDSITILSGDNVIDVVEGGISTTGIGKASIKVAYAYKGTLLEQIINLNVVGVVNHVIHANDQPLVDNTVKLMLGSSVEMNILSGNTPVVLDWTMSTEGNVVSIDGKNVKASNTAFGTQKVAINVNGGTYDFNVVVERPDVYVDGILYANYQTALEKDKTATLTFEYNGQSLEGWTLTSSDLTVVTVLENTITAIKEGQSNIAIKKGDVSFTFTVNVVKAPEEYKGEELVFSAADGVFFTQDLSAVKNIEDILGGPIISAKDSTGKVYTVDALGRVLGVATGKEVGEITLDLYSATASIRIKLKTYTLIIDELEDLSYFTLDGTITYDATNGISYDGDDWNWNGYYVLTKNLDATGDASNHLTLVTNITGSIRKATAEQIKNSGYGLSGVFDGQGYTIKNLGVTGNGSAPGIFTFINGGTVKNVAFENLYSSTQNAPSGCELTSSNLAVPFAQAVVNGGSIQDVYLSYYRLSASTQYRLFVTADETAKVERVVVKENYGTITGSYGGYLIGADSKAQLKDVYLISGVAVTTGDYLDSYKNDSIDSVKATIVLADAYMVDGVEYGVAGESTATYNYLHRAAHLFATKWDLTGADKYYKDVAHTKQYLPYEINKISGIKRYTTLAKFQEDTSNDFSSWNSKVWERVDIIKNI